jgi:hypothetical protein
MTMAYDPHADWAREDATEAGALAARFPVGAEVRNTKTGRHAWVVGTEYSPRDHVRIVQLDYRDGSAPAASSAEFTELVTTPRSEIRHRAEHSTGDVRHGSTRTWRRTLRGVPHAFTAVLMPDGERRYFVSRYNGYCDDGTAEGRTFGMRFGCAWSPVASWTLSPEVSAKLERRAMVARCKRVIRKAGRAGIELSLSDFRLIDGEGPYIDGMDPDEWLDAMTSD